MYLVNFAFQSRVRRLEAQQKKVEDRYYSFVGSLFTFLNPLKTFGIQDRMQERFEDFLKRRFHRTNAGMPMSPLWRCRLSITEYQFYWEM